MYKVLSTITSAAVLTAVCMMLTSCCWCCWDCCSTSACCPRETCCPQPRYCGDQPMDYCTPGYYQYFDAS